MNSSPRDYELVAPETLCDVLALLRDSWSPIAGGTDLMVLLNAGQLTRKRLVSLHRLPDLQAIEVTPDAVRIGAAVTYTAVRGHSLLQAEFELLGRAASWTGGIANQNRGTLGGNIVNASPAADSPPMLLVYDAQLELLSERGPRTVRYEDFHTGYKTMRMQPDELLTRIVLPRSSTPPRAYGRKVGARQAMAISKVSMGALAWLERDRVADIRIAVGSVAPFPLRCRRTEEVIRAQSLSPRLRAEAAAVIASEISPIDDLRSTRDYRVKVTVNLLAEFLDSLQANPVLEQWNHVPETQAASALLTCCGSTQWAQQLAAARPFTDEAQLFEEAGRIWWALSPADWLEAFGSHLEIGAAPTRHQEAEEQSGMREAGDQLRRSMAEANRAYRERFGFLFLICATGKSAAEMLAELERRLNNDRETELREAAAQQRQITHLRLRKWLNG